VSEVLRSPGQPLDTATRAFMEPRFGRDFSGVRVHTDAKAEESARAVSARAYAVGSNVVFGIGQYAPRTAAGNRLIAHELAHVVQQSFDLGAPHIQRAETDTGGQCGGLTDIADGLNTFVNERLRAVLKMLPHPVHPPEMVYKTFLELAKPIMVFLCPVEMWANKQPHRRGGGYSSLFSSVTKGTKYEHAPGALFSYLAPAVNLNGQCVGTDKIGHMFQQGYQYFLISSSAQLSGGPVGAGKGDIYARAWGEWSEGQLSATTKADPKLMSWLQAMSKKPADWYTGMKKGHLGLASTGVHSRADLAANNAGLRFYQDLLAEPTMTFDIRRYVSADWDEEKAGNIYQSDVGGAVKKAGRLTAKDVVLPQP
jgi:hypothetical protein